MEMRSDKNRSICSYDNRVLKTVMQSMAASDLPSLTVSYQRVASLAGGSHLAESLPILQAIRHNIKTATDTAVVQALSAATTADVATLNVSFGLDSVQVSYMLDASFSA
jgi:hypothetical protein